MRVNDSGRDVDGRRGAGSSCISERPGVFQRVLLRGGFQRRRGFLCPVHGAVSEPLVGQFAELADVRAGQRVLDVGCGPGALTAQLVQHLGSGAVAAIDPSASFVAAIRARFPEIDVQRGFAERLLDLAEIREQVTRSGGELLVPVAEGGRAEDGQVARLDVGDLAVDHVASPVQFGQPGLRIGLGTVDNLAQ